MLQLSCIDFRKGTFLFLDGASNNRQFYIIQQGKVACSAPLAPGKNSNRLLSVGDFVGVIPCMSNHLHMENVVSITDTRCIAIRKEQFPDLIAQNTSVALKIIKAFTKRMREMNDEFTKLALNSSSVMSAQKIYDVAKYYDEADYKDIAIYAYYWYMKECPKGEYVEKAKDRFLKLRTHCHAKHFEPTAELSREYDKGTMIMAEGQSGNEMFVIQKGQVAITKIVDGSEVVLAVLKEGDMLGEMALLENKPRSASAIARENSVLTVINRSNFDKMVQTQPQLITRLTTTLADRLWFMYKQFSNTCLKDPMHKVIDMLAIQLEKDKHTEGSYNMSLTPNDLVNMCGFPKEAQDEVLGQVMHKSMIKVVKNNIVIPDCKSIINFAVLYKKQEEADRIKEQQKIKLR